MNNRWRLLEIKNWTVLLSRTEERIGGHQEVDQKQSMTYGAVSWWPQEATKQCYEKTWGSQHLQMKFHSVLGHLIISHPVKLWVPSNYFVMDVGGYKELHKLIVMLQQVHMLPVLSFGCFFLKLCFLDFKVNLLTLSVGSLNNP